MSQRTAISCILDLISKDSTYYPLFARAKDKARILVSNEECIIICDDYYEAIYIYANSLEVFLNYIEDIDFYYFKILYTFDERIAYYLECLHNYQSFEKIKVHTFTKENIDIQKMTLIPLDITYLGMIRSYFYLSDEEIEKRIDNKMIFACFDNEEIMGMIGYRQDGLIDIFHVFKSYHGHNIDYLLETNLIFKMLLDKKLPYTFTTSSKAAKLQKRIGFNTSESYILMSIKND